MASEIWNAPAHLKAARYFAASIIQNMGPNPMPWPTGERAPGSAGLFVGMTGTAMILARLVHPDRGVASPSLFAQTVP